MALETLLCTSTVGRGLASLPTVFMARVAMMTAALRLLISLRADITGAKVGYQFP
jgi:hypothetical protein